MTRQVHVISAAMIPMGRHRESSYVGLAAPAVITALRDSGLTTDRIGAVYCGHAFGGMLTGQRIVKETGLAGIPVVNVDNACSGGASAVHLAAEAVARGAQETALVIGVDKLTQFGGGTLPLVAEDWEVQQGMVMPALYAMRARRYLHDRDGTVADLARLSVKNRRHGSKNPYAQYQKEVTVEEVLASRPIAEPLTLLQCCPTGDGAAALVVVADEVWRGLGQPPSMRIAASVLHSGGFEPGFRDMTRPEISYDSAREAYEQASIDPSDIDVVELHDAFTVAELVYYEALGLCPQGEAIGLLRSGGTTYGGQVVVNPSGGLLAKGHPVGASGVAQVVEAFWQLTGRAGARQVPGARTALTHVTGGGIAGLDHGACAVHIFEAAQ
ncbi:thiolase family protein [Micromonospora sp. WMMD1082]|uniref:thiolase family protein n=1 Tax=Micromonospora sp. WMMD1082 TaxID=3016104 RepID=UPI002416A958|nr:thiolase family protein [Micromonospora sp. WMMD1082]MDG4798337.1 thiolase family protein [Micromonospora sp. WMMD1082]